MSNFRKSEVGELARDEGLGKLAEGHFNEVQIFPF